MNLFSEFKQKLVRNYLTGSITAVAGVGAVFIFSTLLPSREELILLAAILALSTIIMAVSESWFFFRQVKVIKEFLTDDSPSLKKTENAYYYTLDFPAKTVKRILGPHFLGISIPGAGLSALAVYFGYLKLPYSYIVFAIIGAVLVAGMHALIEFFLTGKAVQPIVRYIQNSAALQFGVHLTLKRPVHISIKRKIQLSIVFIGTFPLVLFALATQVHLLEKEAGISSGYWSWAAYALVTGIIFAVTGAFLLYRDMQQPMFELKAAMNEVKNGNSQTRLVNVYPDEFSVLFNGFNHMSDAIVKRDYENRLMLESFFSTFAATLDARDPYTAGHSLRVADLSVVIGEKAGLSQQQLFNLRKSALLHDIGKIGIPDGVLLKEGTLTEIEFESIKKHPVIGAEILSQVQPPEAMRALMPGVKYHHERYDGKGYPEGLAGNSIPLFGRIIAVADAFDAMTSDRPYKKGMTFEKALLIIERGKGSQWDPYFADLFIEQMKMTFKQSS
ncbi:HD domain-containing phosphohydrolase [Fictibacillus iocasae]|uniref:HD domain-containing phosphohydrolase n=1 Tax=Fictibacillus iocasae TaxID=2715437 RepID=A0ABW2NWZ9_9BACL